jgi:predicted regulator of Ras-like GTPase activity (Roadblock/LC7/MglB family)
LNAATDAELQELTEGIRSSLATLRDVGGVAGSFVCAEGGRLLAREIPALFEDSVLSEAGSRLLRMGEAFAAVGDELDMALVRYGDHRVYLKWVSGGLLCVVVTGRVNMPALRMAVNLVCRRISAAVAQVQAAMRPAPAVERTAEQTAPSESAAVPSPTRASYPGMRRFRDRSAG